jgi:hypothetical protein
MFRAMASSRHCATLLARSRSRLRRPLKLPARVSLSDLERGPMIERSCMYGLQALRVFLLGGVFVFSSPLPVNDGHGHAWEFETTSASIGKPSPRDLINETFELVSGAAIENQPVLPPAIANEAKEPEITESDIPAARPLLNEIDQYLWSVYQRSGTKRDSSGDFTWKDGAAATRLGLLPQEYVIGGMDPDFRELLFDLGHAMDAAGVNWTILSGFRDDYRQHLAAGFKAHGGNSFHGGSIATGGYGHGCAADLEASDGGDSNDMVWKWLDQHGERFGVHRPMRQSDPAHIQPFGAWHEAAAELRDKRVEIRNADLRSSTNTNADESVSPVLASHSGVSEAQFDCVRSHSAGRFRTARLGHFRTARLEHLRTARLERSRTAEPERSKTAEPEHSRTAEPEHSGTAEPEHSRTAELEHSRTAGLRHSRMTSLSHHLRPRIAPVLTLDTDRPHRNPRWRTIVDIRSLQQRSAGEASRHHARSRARLHFVGHDSNIRSAGAVQAGGGRS